MVWCSEEKSMVAGTPERSEDDIEPSESTDAARMLRDVLAADRGVEIDETPWYGPARGPLESRDRAVGSEYCEPCR